MINEILEISKPFMIKTIFSKLSFENSLKKNLDSAVEMAESREKNLKKKSKELQQISEELTYIFWS